MMSKERALFFLRIERRIDCAARQRSHYAFENFMYGWVF